MDDDLAKIASAELGLSGVRGQHVTIPADWCRRLLTLARAGAQMKAERDRLREALRSLDAVGMFDCDDGPTCTGCVCCAARAALEADQ